jgi:RNA polymerase sigma-70 factor (ECF subfamily)
MRETGQASNDVSALLKGLFRELYQRSGGGKIGLSETAFCRILASIGAKYLPASAGVDEQRGFYSNLKVEELALARACADGQELAWEVFLTRYRTKLYEMSMRIVRESSGARQLADSLYADLYGMPGRDGERVSKLSFYTGRGSLEGWLRTVLAQEHVNQYRRIRREVSLEEEAEDGAQFAAPHPSPEPVADGRLEAATDDALRALPAEDRFILAAYFLDDRTLADIARSLGVHESTISRKLDKLTKGLRKQLVSGLVRRGMSRRQAEETLETDVRDVQLDIRKTWRKISTANRSHNIRRPQRLERAVPEGRKNQRR